MAGNSSLSLAFEKASKEEFTRFADRPFEKFEKLCVSFKPGGSSASRVFATPIWPRTIRWEVLSGRSAEPWEGRPSMSRRWDDRSGLWNGSGGWRSRAEPSRASWENELGFEGSETRLEKNCPSFGGDGLGGGI